jgi:hypothetical protein
MHSPIPHWGSKMNSAQVESCFATRSVKGIIDTKTWKLTTYSLTIMIS